LSYRHPWSRTFETGDTYTYGCGPTGGCPVPCPDHEPYCWRAVGLVGQRMVGNISLVDPVKIPVVMPGTKQKLLELSIPGLLDNGVGWGYRAASSIKLLVDEAQVLYRNLYHASDWAGAPNKFTLDKDVSGAQLLQFILRMDCDGGMVGYATLHHAKLKIDGEYYNDVPPVTATVRLTITNSKTGALVKGAYVALMSGARIVADGYTDGGEVKFENINEGSYTVKVVAGGYYEFEQSIEVEPPSVWYVIKIVPIPTVPTPTWVYWAVGGVAALGAITVIPSIIRRKEERVVVVK